MSTSVLKMSLTHASTLGVAARAVADTVGALGLGPAERTHLEALMSEALTAVIADSFDGADVIDVDVAVNHEPGGVDIVLKHHGAPSTYVSGELPIRLETLLSLGYADSMRFASDGLKGSELRISRELSLSTLKDDPSFLEDAAKDDESDLLVDTDDMVIRPITGDDVVAVARLYFRTYGYTKIGMSWLYEPEVFRHKIETGIHEAIVAVLPSGRIVGHAGIVRPAPDSVSASGGPAAVDPAFRERNIATLLEEVLVPRMIELGLRGIHVEAVTAHPASQATLRKAGCRETGLVLARQPADVEFLGFDGPRGFRRATVIFYRSLGDSVTEAAYVPARYVDVIERIYGEVGLARTITSDAGRRPTDLPLDSRFSTELLAATKHAQIRLVEYGQDFVEALQRLIVRFESERFEVITVHLPLMNPLTAYFGAGLGELGLSFNAIFPEQEFGDELVLGVNLSEQDPETIHVASDFCQELLDYVMADRDRVTAALESRARSRASMARILDAL